MSKIVDSIIGHAIGDAMGMPTEFYQRKNLLKNPITVSDCQHDSSDDS